MGGGRGQPPELLAVGREARGYETGGGGHVALPCAMLAGSRPLRVRPRDAHGKSPQSGLGWMEPFYGSSGSVEKLLFEAFKGNL